MRTWLVSCDVLTTVNVNNGMWRHVVWYTVTKVSNKSAGSIFRAQYAKIEAFCNVVLCCWFSFGRSEGTHCVIFRVLNHLALNMKALPASEKLESTYQITQHHIPENLNFQSTRLYKYTDGIHDLTHHYFNVHRILFSRLHNSVFASGFRL
jgi:hypothetical protein